MHARPDKVRARRVRRRIKAALSIGVALAAGIFLACQKNAAPEKSEDAGEGEAARSDDAARGATPPTSLDDREAGGAEAAVTSDASAGLVDAAKPDALAKRPAHPRDAAVDRREHRKGMPVPDNLLE
jgi:hypothetical protein